MVGPAVNWLGTIFVILSLGMAPFTSRSACCSRWRSGCRPAGWASGDASWCRISPVVGGLPGDGVGVHHREWLVRRVARLSWASSRCPSWAASSRCYCWPPPAAKGTLCPGLVLRLLGNPVVLAGTYLFFLGAIFVYGLFIYQEPIQRAVTLLIGVAIVVVTVEMLRRGALKKRAVVELHADYSPGRMRGTSSTSLSAGSRP